MNASIKDPSHPSILYYDSDYPSREFSRYPENFDPIVRQQGIADDVAKYRQLARLHGKKVLELCCGTGRVSIPLVLDGCEVTAVDISNAVLKRFKNKIEAIPDFPFEKLTIIRQDVTRLALTDQEYDLVICAFNSLLCIPDFTLQQQTLANAATRLKQKGVLALDIWNPLVINLLTDEIPHSYFTRKRVDNGNVYTRFAGTGPMDVNQVQQVYGWYDEQVENGGVRRTSYHMEWRLIFRYEIELMLEKAGLKIQQVFGGNHDEPFETGSQKMFILACKA
jgi:SAM-dependent methyltransferase